MTSIHLTVATVIKQDEYFLTVRETSPNRPGMEVINQPAGHVEPGETLLEAAVRETLEETGWLCDITYPIGIYHYRSPASNTQYLRFCFAGKLLQRHHCAPPDPTILTTEWLTLKEIENIHRQAERAKQNLTHAAASAGPPRHPEVLRSPIVITCFKDYDCGTKLPWHCLQEHTLINERQPTTPHHPPSAPPKQSTNDKTSLTIQETAVKEMKPAS